MISWTILGFEVWTLQFYVFYTIFKHVQINRYIISPKVDSTANLVKQSEAARTGIYTTGGPQFPEASWWDWKWLCSHLAHVEPYHRPLRIQVLWRKISPGPFNRTSVVLHGLWKAPFFCIDHQRASEPVMYSMSNSNSKKTGAQPQQGTYGWHKVTITKFA